MPYSRPFRSRWSGQLWAAGVLWIAYDVADTNAPANDPIENAADLNTIAALVANVS